MQLPVSTRRSAVRLFLAALLLAAAGCASPYAQPKSPVNDDNRWEVPEDPVVEVPTRKADRSADESDTFTLPEAPPSRNVPPAPPPPPAPETAPEPSSDPDPVPPPTSEPDAAQEDAEAPAEAEAASEPRGWWPFGGKKETPEPDPEPVDLAPGVVTETSDPPPAPDSADVPEELREDTAMSTVLAYRLRVGDAIIIRITGPEQHLVEDQIDERGNISLPLISEPIHVEGLTGSQLESDIRRLYVEQKKIYRHCSVTVIVPGRTYTVDGEFLKKGTYPISPGVTLVRAVASAGGFGPWANPKKLKLIRNGVTRVINYYELRDEPGKDIIIEPGDIIIAPRSPF